ncbi:hypothetical protein K1T71_015273 [Dendrolimus kikuchii]|nr:hypothetical protein K1T71_015273 [Dendrolimus kikuchii]
MSVPNASLIYSYKKEELLKIISELNISVTGSETVEQLRRLLSKKLKATRALQLANQGTIKPKSKNKIMTNYEIKQFDGGDWEVFEQQLDCVVLLNEISEDKKVPLLITKLSPVVFVNLLYLCEPISPLKKQFNELCKVLKENYSKTTSYTINRTEFRKRNQHSNESIEEFVFQLRKLAKNCKFPDNDDQIKEKLIDGVSSQTISMEMIKNSDLSLNKLITIGRSLEAALQLNSGKSNGNNEGNMFTNQIKRKSNNSWKTQREQNKQEIKCYCCGKNNHVRAQCSLNKKYCSECGKQGHIFKMCPSKRLLKSTVNIVIFDIGFFIRFVLYIMPDYCI